MKIVLLYQGREYYPCRVEGTVMPEEVFKELVKLVGQGEVGGILCNDEDMNEVWLPSGILQNSVWRLAAD